MAGALMSTTGVLDEIIDLGTRELYRKNGLLPNDPCTWADPKDNPASLAGLIWSWHAWLGGETWAGRHISCSGTGNMAVVGRSQLPNGQTFEQLTIREDTTKVVIEAVDAFVGRHLDGHKPIARPRSIIDRNLHLQDLWASFDIYCPNSVARNRLGDVEVESFADPICRVSQEAYLYLDSISEEIETKTAEMDEYYQQLLDEEKEKDNQ